MVLGDVILVRRAGLDREALRGFHHAEIELLLAENLTARRRLAASAAVLSDGLHHRIASSFGTERGRLVAARRAIHNGTDDQRLLDFARAALAPEFASSLDEWAHERRAIEARRTRLREALTCVESKEIELVRRLCAVPSFSRGLAATSPQLADRAARLLLDPTLPLRRKPAIVLARMIARVAAKTSPFSTWMTTAPAEWGRLGTGLDEGRVVAELDGVSAERLVERLREILHRRSELRLRVNPSLVCTPNGYLYMRAGVQEELVRVASNPAIAAVLAAASRPLTVAELKLAVPGVAAWIERCRIAQLLEPIWPVADQSPRPWRDWANALNEESTLSSHLRDLDRALAGAQSASARAAAHEIAASLEIDLSTIEIHEVCVGTAPSGDAPARPNLEDVEELDAIRKLLSLFDSKLPAKIAATELFEWLFGAEYNIPFTVALEALRRAVADPTTDMGRLLGPTVPPWGADLGRCASPRLRALAITLRDVGVQVLASAELGPLSVVQARAYAAAINIEHPNTSATMYLQDLQLHDVRRVINVVHGGHGRGRGRFAAQAGIEVRGLTAEPAEDVVEFSGLLGSTLNARQPNTRRELQYPGTSTNRPATDQLSMSAVRVVAGRIPELRDADGHRVRPVHLGMAADLALPPFARLIEQIFGSAFLVHPSAPPFAPVRPGAYELAVTRTPRVVIGRTVVQRERWFAPIDALPDRTRCAEDRIEAWFRWIDQNGIGTRFFLRAWDPANVVGRSKARKPIYVDLSSSLLLADAEKLLQGARFVIIEECLPDPLDGGGAVTEYALQLGEDQ